MAQIGSFVPCKYAFIPLFNRILARIGTNDDMEYNLSSFSLEMKEVAYMFDNITNQSLVIIDELGRGTSNIEGEISLFITILIFSHNRNPTI